MSTTETTCTFRPVIQAASDTKSVQTRLVKPSTYSLSLNVSPWPPTNPTTYWETRCRHRPARGRSRRMPRSRRVRSTPRAKPARAGRGSTRRSRRRSAESRTGVRHSCSRDLMIDEVGRSERQGHRQVGFTARRCRRTCCRRPRTDSTCRARSRTSRPRCRERSGPCGSRPYGARPNYRSRGNVRSSAPVIEATVEQPAREALGRVVELRGLVMQARKRIAEPVAPT